MSETQISEEVKKPEEKQAEQITLTQPTVVEKQTITKESALESGWSEDEVTKAEGQGLITKEEPGKPGEEGDAGKAGDGAGKGEPKPGEGDPDKKKEAPKERPTKSDYALSEEEETKFSDSFGPGSNVSGLFHGMKSQRKRAQSAERQRDDALISLKVREKEMEGMQSRLERLENKALGIDDGGENLDDKPLTARDLKEMKDAEVAEKAKSDIAIGEQAARVNKAISDQVEFARTEYKDYDKAIKLSEEIVAKIVHNKGDIELDVVTTKKARKLIADMNILASKADTVTLDEYNIADVVYELAMLNPSANGETKPGNEADTRLNGERTAGATKPDITDRIEKNVSRRNSSASLSGISGSRAVSPEDVTLADINVMTSAQRGEFKIKYPAKYNSILRD